MTNDNWHYNCTCGWGGVVISAWPDDEEIGISIWEPRTPGSKTWSSRLRHIWNIATKGYPYADDIILSRKDALELGMKLIDLSFPIVTHTDVYPTDNTGLSKGAPTAD